MNKRVKDYDNVSLNVSHMGTTLSTGHVVPRDPHVQTLISRLSFTTSIVYLNCLVPSFFVFLPFLLLLEKTELQSGVGTRIMVFWIQNTFIQLKKIIFLTKI